MKELTFEEMSLLGGQAGGADCALAVVTTVLATVAVGAAVAAGPATGGVSAGFAWSFFGSKILGIAGI
jgi:hypothetical protein